MMQAYAQTHLNVLVVINVGSRELKKKTDESNTAACFSCLFLSFSLHHSILVIAFFCLEVWLYLRYISQQLCTSTEIK